MARGILSADIDYAQLLLQARTADAKVVQALVYRGLAANIAEQLVDDVRNGRQVILKELDPPSAESTQERGKETSVVEPTPSRRHNCTPAQGVRLAVILPPVLALALALTAVWWRKAAEGSRVRELAANQALAEARSEKLAHAKARVPLVIAQAADCVRSGEVAAGLKLVDALLAEVDAPELHDAKVDLLIKAGRLNEAYQMLVRLLQEQPEEAYLHFKAGLLAEIMKRPTDASSHFAEACRLASQNKSYRVAWAKACLKTGASDQVQLALPSQFRRRLVVEWA